MTCPWCDSRVTKADSFLGRLGCLLHYRCRYCGGMFNRPVPKERLKKEGVL